MKRKRKSDAAKLDDKAEADSLSKPKNLRKELTHLEFKTMLKDPNTIFAALEGFVEQARGYQDDLTVDIVADYCRTSAECAEVFRLLETGKRKPSEYYHLFEVLECILLRTAGDLESLKIVGENIVRKLLSSHMRPLYFMLNEKNKALHIRGTLRLLAAMVAQGERCARDVTLQFNFHHKALPQLFERRDMKFSHDVRHCLLSFICGILLMANNAVIKQLLEIKGFVNSIFRGLAADKFITLQMILPVLKDKIVENLAINKTTKIRLFSARNLKDVSRLFRWKGPVHWKAAKLDVGDDKNQVIPASEEEIIAVQQCAHGLLKALCCSIHTGITFYDRQFSTSGKNMNHTLTDFLTSLNFNYTDPLVQDLVASTLAVCPDQLQWYLPSLQHYLSPRPKPKWKVAMDFLTKIYEKQSAHSPALRGKSAVSSKKLVDMVIATLVPPKVIWDHLCKTVKSRNGAVQVEGCHFMSKVIQRALATVKQCDSPSEGTVLFCMSQTEQQQFVTDFKESFCKMLPSVNILKQSWKLLVGGTTKMDDSRKDMLPDDDSSDSEKEEQLDDSKAQQDEDVLPSVDPATRAQCLLLVLSQYQQIGALPPEQLDAVSLLDGAQRLGTKEDVTNLHLAVIDLLSHVNVRHLSWTRETAAGDTLLSVLLHLVYSFGKDATNKETIVKEFSQLLCGTSLFDNTESELITWLLRLQQVPKGHASDVIKLLEKSLAALFTEPYHYTDIITDVLSEAYSTDGHLATDVSSAATSENLIDTILSLDDEDLDLQESTKSTTDMNSVSSFRLPFSPLIPAVLEVLSKEKFSGHGVEAFCELVLLSVLDQQTQPAALCVLLQRYQQLTTPRLAAYVSQLVPSRQSQVKDTKVPDIMKLSGELSELLRTSFLAGPDVLLKDKVKDKLTSAVEGTIPGHISGIVKQILLYASNYGHRIKKVPEAAEIIELYLGMLEKLVIIARSGLQVNLDNNLKHGTDVIGKQGGGNADADGGVDGVKVTPMETDECDEEQLNRKENISQPQGHGQKENVICDEYVTVLSSIMDHSDVKHWFLGESKLLTPAKQKKTTKKLSCLFTKGVSSLMKTVCKDILQKVPNLESTMNLYVGKIQQIFTCNVEDIMESDFLPTQHHVLAAVSSFKFSYSWEILIQIIVKFLKILSKLASEKENYEQYSDVVLELLNSLMEKLRTNYPHKQIVPSEILQPLLDLVCATKDNKFDEFAAGLCDISPGVTSSFREEHFVILIKTKLPSKLSVLCSAVKQSYPCLMWFEQWLTSGSHLKKAKKRREILPVVAAYLQQAGKDNTCIKELASVYREDLLAMTVSSAVPSKASETAILALCQTMSLQDSEAWLEKLRDSTASQPWTLLHVKAVQTLHRHILDLCKENHAAKLQVFMPAVATELHKHLQQKQRNQEAELLLSEELHNCLQKMESLADDIMSGVKQTLQRSLQPIWETFCKGFLRHHFTTPSMLIQLSRLVTIVCDGGIQVDPSISVLYQMVFSHSKFMEVMLSREEKLQIKDSLLDLLLAVTSADSTCCDTAHLAVLFGAYGASLSTTDQKLLQLLQKYEENGAKMSHLKPYMWGEKAVEHYITKKALGPSLWRTASVDQVLDLVDADLLYESALHFPLRRQLQAGYQQNAEELQSQEQCYDPSFFLPLLAEIVSPGNFVPCKKFVRSNCLGYTLAAFSSHQADVRGLASLILTRFIPHLEGAKFGEKDEVLYVLECVKNSIEKPNGKLTSVITLFLVKSLGLLFKPEEHMYPLVSNYMLLRPGMDPLALPEFFKLFNSSSMQFKQERSWILNHLADGLRETADYRIFERKYAFKFLQTFYSSTISDGNTQMEVLTVIRKAVTLQNVTLDLVRYHGLVTWLDGIISSCGKSPEKTSLLVIIFKDLWYTMLGNRDTQLDKQMDTHTQPCLPVHFTNDMLHTVWSLLDLLARNQMDQKQIETFLEMLLSMLKHLAKTQHLYPKHQGYVAWNHLATRHILQVLALWQRVAKDEYLHQQLFTIGNICSFSMKSKYSWKGLASQENMDEKLPVISKLSKFQEETVLASNLNRHLCSVVLEIICHWTVKDTDTCDTLSGMDSPLSKIVSVSFYVLKWVLEQCLYLRKYGYGANLFSSVTGWMVQIFKSDIGGKRWVEYIAPVPELTTVLTDLLLVLYTTQADIEEVDLLFLQNLNEIFLLLLDTGDVLQENDRNPLLLACKLAKSAPYHQAFSNLKANNNKKDRILATLMLELFSGCTDPKKCDSTSVTDT